MTKVYALVDCDAFFCSCERVFRPELKNRPIIVLSNNDGCAVSRTKDAKVFGIEMGAPYFKIKDLCEENNIAIFSSNFSLYTDMSRRVMSLLKTFAPLVEVYSVDEAFLDLSGISNIEDYARNIKKTVEAYTKIPISIGIAPTKGLCKAACYLAKRDKSYNGVVSLLDEKEQDSLLRKMPVHKLWGIAKRRALHLRTLGLTTAKKFRDYNNDRCIQKILTKVGRQIQDELRGIICFPINPKGEKKKEIMSSRTFGQPIYDKITLKQTIASHVHEIAEELRFQKSVCREILVFVRSNPYKEGINQYGASKKIRLDSPTAHTFKLIQKAFNALDEIWQSGIEYKKSGVRVSALQDEQEFQLSLFNAPDNEKDKVLMTTMDKINNREGPRTIKSMACGTSNFAWYMNRNFKSPRYTTSWHEIPRVNYKGNKYLSK